MFGIGGRRRERRLRREGVAAMATVLSVRRSLSGAYTTDDPFYQSPPKQATPGLWMLRVRVEPHGAAAFEATVEAWLFDTERPFNDTVIPVLFDPADPAAVVLDRSRQTQDAARDATFAARDRWLAEQAKSPVDRLTELMALRDRGVLTAAEYDAEKRKILGT